MYYTTFCCVSRILFTSMDVVTGWVSPELSALPTALLLFSVSEMSLSRFVCSSTIKKAMKPRIEEIKRVRVCDSIPMYELEKNAIAEAADCVNLNMANAAADLSAYTEPNMENSWVW